jgi:WD40 repeat protein
MPGHTDTVTGMALSPDGSFVLTNAMDNTVRCPFCESLLAAEQIFGANFDP